MEAARRRRSRLSLLPDAGGNDEEPDEPTFVFRVPERMRRSSIAPVEVTQQDLEELIKMGAEDSEMPMQEDDALEDLDEATAMALLDQIGVEDTMDAVQIIDDQADVLSGDGEDDGVADETTIGRHGQTTILNDPTHMSLHSALPISKPRAPRKPKRTLISKHGIPYPSLPASTVKRLATAFARTSGAGSKNGKISKEAIAELMQATDWFFEQAGGDLASYAAHRRGKTVEQSDVVALMRR